jgi:hypothetical protein
VATGESRVREDARAEKLHPARGLVQLGSDRALLMRRCAGARRGVQLDSRQPSSTEVLMRLIGLVPFGDS